MARIPNPNATRAYLSDREIRELGLHQEQLSFEWEKKRKADREKDGPDPEDAK